MLKHVHLEGTVEPPITDWARSWAVATQAGLTDRLPSETLAVEAERLLAADEEKWAKAVAKQRTAVGKRVFDRRRLGCLASPEPPYSLALRSTCRAVFSKEGLASKLTETAMTVTRGVVEAQNAQRKAFLQHLRRAQSRAAAAKTRWARLRDHHTHPRGKPHNPSPPRPTTPPRLIQPVRSGVVRAAQLPIVMAAGCHGGPRPRARAPAPCAAGHPPALPQAACPT